MGFEIKISTLAGSIFIPKTLTVQPSHPWVALSFFSFSLL
jgi:hypothetical protein